MSTQAPKITPTRVVRPPVPLPTESYGQALSSHQNIPVARSGSLNREMTVQEHQAQCNVSLPDPSKNVMPVDEIPMNAPKSTPPRAVKPPISMPIENHAPHSHPTLPTIQSGSLTHESMTQRHRNLSNQPLPDLPKNVSPQRKPTRDDNKDRTVLSVSGKKRCSSCKEELGRGAAAFVVESLSLVYHTNCFRCSVCHVNLSNGFRGVDVRVHAGALHCQNCYSKDGLNYSRV